MLGHAPAAFFVVFRGRAAGAGEGGGEGERRSQSNKWADSTVEYVACAAGLDVEARVVDQSVNLKPTGAVER